MWFKLCDRSHSHPKVIDAGNAAWGLFCRLGAWSAEKGTDGRVSDGIMRQYAESPEQIAKLFEVGLLEHAERGASLHDFLDFNPTAAEVAKLRKARTEAGRRGAERTNAARAIEIPILDKIEKRRGSASAAASAAATRPASAAAKSRPDPDPVEEINLSRAATPSRTARGGEPAPLAAAFPKVLGGRR